MFDKVKKIFYRLGFIVQRIPNEDVFFKNLAYADKAVQQHELRKLAQHLKIANNHKLYNKILKNNVQGWSNNFTKAEFIGYGTGEYSFDVYRKVCFRDKRYFEKVYFNDSYDLLKVLWFYEHVFPILRDSVKIAKIYRVLKGDLITIIYFEYLDLVPLSNDIMKSVLFNLSKTLLKLSEKVPELSDNAPDYLKNYTSHFQYYKNIKRAKKLIKALSNNKFTTNRIEQVLDTHSLIITHGDIYQTNVFTDNNVIDWDSFGFFPYGFESALILAMQKETIVFDDLIKLLIKEYKDVICKEQWDDFELSCLYFYLIFTALNGQNEAHATLQKNIFKRIEKLYYIKEEKFIKS